jgi:hypothetical protein
MYDTRFIKAVVFLSSVVASLVVPGCVFAFSTFSVGGNASTASIQATVDAFRAALGNPNNGNAAGPLASGRREINWDGGGPPVDANAPGGTPFNVFLNTRGGQFTTPGTGFLQGPPSGGADGGFNGFFNNPTLGDIFGVFSPNRIFSPVESNVTDGFFFIPGTNGLQPATVSAFGAVFTDVDLANTTSIQFFDTSNNLITNQFVPVGTVPDKSLSFFGLIGNADEQIARVRITTGNAPISSTSRDGGLVDLVAMDDFIYAEPKSVPDSGGIGLLGIRTGFRSPLLPPFRASFLKAKYVCEMVAVEEGQPASPK